MNKFWPSKNSLDAKNFVILFVSTEFSIVAKGYSLFYYYPDTGEQKYFSRLNDPKNALCAKMRLLRRLLRAEIRCLYHFQNDIWMCIAKKGIFKYHPDNQLFEKCCEIEKGSRPMCLCQSNDGTIYYGEYCHNPARKPMRIFQSRDNGDSWSVAYTFVNGVINHIHGIFQDPFSEKVWVATGDEDSACIFGYTEDGFKTFVRCFEGNQKYRVCHPLFTVDEIIFATDSPLEQNYIRSINRVTGVVKDICAIQGSGIYGAQSGNLMMISTTVEPSIINLDNCSHVWYSFDGHEWKELSSYKKDCWNQTYFQFGSIRFPIFEGPVSCIAYNGRALKGIDQKSVIVSIGDLI